MAWAFVDYENTGSLEAVTVSTYEKVLVFCGPKNQRINFGSIPTDGFCCIEVIGTSTVGPNNLDFVLAFHLGRLHEIAEKEIEFHIVSNDGGFDGLVNHLKKIGRKCKKVATKARCKPKAGKPVFSECASLVVGKLKAIDGRKRPRKQSKLLNWIKSHCAGISGFPGPEVICKELMDAQLVRVEGSALRYNLT